MLLIIRWKDASYLDINALIMPYIHLLEYNSGMNVIILCKDKAI